MNIMNNMNTVGLCQDQMCNFKNTMSNLDFISVTKIKPKFLNSNKYDYISLCDTIYFPTMNGV